MHIDIYHDTVCPWCRVGKRNLQVALESWQGEPITISYKTFFLNEGIPPDGEDFRTLMAEKGGGRIPLETMFDGPRRAGERVGLNFNFEAITRAPNTTLSHQLIALTPEAHKVAVIDAIYKAYFEDAKDIGRLDVLIDIAREIGLDAADLETRLAAGEMHEEILTEAHDAHGMGITGVPFFIFNGLYAMSGAQPPAAFTNVLQQIVERTEGITTS